MLGSLSESRIRQIVRDVLNELDYSSMPIGGDAIERNKWWKQQLDNDFPNHGIQHSNNWQDEYYKFNSIQQKKEKEQQKKEKKRLRKERVSKEIEELTISVKEHIESFIEKWDGQDWYFNGDSLYINMGCYNEGISGVYDIREALPDIIIPYNEWREFNPDFENGWKNYQKEFVADADNLCRYIYDVDDRLSVIGKGCNVLFKELKKYQWQLY